MEFALIIGKQILTMFLYIAVGFVLYRANLITKEGSRGLANLLLYCILPCVIINSFQAERTAEKMYEVGLSMGIGAAVLLLAIVMAALVFRKAPMDNFSSAFSNAGFMGFPLVTAALGASATFYTVGFVALLNVVQWTYGQWILSGDKNQISPRSVVKNPCVIAMLIGLALFFTGLPLPGVVLNGMKTLAGANAPVAMVILGVYLAQTDLKKLFSNPRIYLVSGVRLVLIPLLTLGVLALTARSMPAMAMALLLTAAAPVGSNVAVYAQKLNKDYTYAVQLVCVSTLLSICTMPVIAALAQQIFPVG